MRLVYNFNIKKRDELLDLCKISKDLYNQGLFLIKENLKNHNKFLFYHDLDKIMKTSENLDGEINYRKLKSQVSQQILKLLEKDIKSYIRSIKEYSKNKSKFKGIPKLPNYKNTHNLLIFTNQCSTIKDGYIHFSKNLKLKIPQWEKYNSIINFNQIRVIPKKKFIKIEIVYEKEIINPLLDHNEYSSIDLGVNNLVTLISSGGNPLLISGKQIKSINQWFNKELSRLNSIKDRQNNKKTTRNIRKLYEKRDNILKDLFHKVSRFIVNFLVKNKIGNLVLGYNKNWKDSISIGKRNNQNFVQIPYQRLLNYLSYKCKLVGINLQLTEESYTSKCSSLDLEPIKKHDNYVGKRIKRGIFRTKTGKLINSDVNGSLNILRKVIDDSYISKIIDRGLLFNPLKIRDLFNINSNFLLKNLVNC